MLIKTLIKWYLINLENDKFDFFIMKYDCNIIAKPLLAIRIINNKNLIKESFIVLMNIIPFVISKKTFKCSNLIMNDIMVQKIMLHSIESNKLGRVLIILK